MSPVIISARSVVRIFVWGLIVALTPAARAQSRDFPAEMLAVGTLLNTAETTAQIRQSGLEARREALSTIDARMESTGKSMERLERSTRRFEGEVRERTEASLKNVRAKEKALRSSVKAARRAVASEWSEARERVAASYEAYAQSVASAEASIGLLDAQGFARVTPAVSVSR